MESAEPPAASRISSSVIAGTRSLPSIETRRAQLEQLLSNATSPLCSQIAALNNVTRSVIRKDCTCLSRTSNDSRSGSTPT